MDYHGMDIEVSCSWGMHQRMDACTSSPEWDCDRQGAHPKQPDSGGLPELHPWQPARFLVGSCPPPAAPVATAAQPGAGHWQHAIGEAFSVGSCPSSLPGLACRPRPPTAAARQHPYSLSGRPSLTAGQQQQQPQQLQAAPAAPAPAVPAAAGPATAAPAGSVARRQLFGAPTRQQLDDFFTAQEEQVHARKAQRWAQFEVLA